MSEEIPQIDIANSGSTDQLADSIERLITDRSLTPGDRIGAERELAERFGVSRWAIRKALEDLESAGLILRTHGRSGGVFVSPKKVVRDLSPLVGLPEYLRTQGIEAGTTILGTKAGSPEEKVRLDLELPQDDWAFQVHRLRLAGGLPLSIEVCNFSADLFPGLLDQPLNGSLYELLESEYRIKRGDAVETISVVKAAEQEASVLQVSIGTPLLVVERIARLKTGRVFESSREMYRADRMSIVVHTGGGSKASPYLLPAPGDARPE